ncbi:MAG: SPOR domain-containing protein [Jhaorihella sp.]
MADIEYAGDVRADGAYPEAGGSSIGFFVNVLGALTSLALVAGVGVWGYWLLVRDVSGVPVVRALEGPLRVQPENPGGEPADYQGLAVNAVAAEGAASPPADRLILAPRPVGLSEEDAPMGRIEPAAAQSGTETAPAPRAVGEADADPAGTQMSEAAIAELVEELTSGATPLSGNEVPPPEQAGAAADGNADDAGRPDPAVLNAPGLQRSLRPQTRPARAVRSLADDAASQGGASVMLASARASDSLDVDPDSLPAGTRLAQLGAYDTAEIARAEWDRLYARFGDYLDGKNRVIQQASSGGRTFYRLRAMGFDDLSDARRFCSALVAENADCIPVTSR